MRWVDYIIEAMVQLGGDAYYPELYEKVKEIHPGPLSSTWKATVRKTIENHSSDSDNYSDSHFGVNYSPVKLA